MAGDINRAYNKLNFIVYCVLFIVCVDTSLVIIIVIIKTALNILCQSTQTLNYLLNRQRRMFISKHDETKRLNMQKGK